MQSTGNTSGINPTLMSLLYDTTPEELILIDSNTRGFSNEQIQQFVMIYRTKRKDEQTILLCCLLGLVFFAGIHRFLMGADRHGHFVSFYRWPLPDWYHCRCY